MIENQIFFNAALYGSSHNFEKCVIRMDICGAISKALNRMQVTITKDVVLRTAPQIADNKIDVMAQLSKINESIHKEFGIFRKRDRPGC